MMYKEHSLAERLKDCLILEYTPNWIKNTPDKRINNHNIKIENKKENKKIIDWNTF